MDGNQIDRNSLTNQIMETESKILNVERDLALLKGELESLRVKYADSIDVNWRDEIRQCIVSTNDQPIFTSYDVILNSIEAKFHLVASNNVKKNLIMTLSLMFKEGDIGRVEVNDIYYYGLGILFTNDNSTVIKEEFQSLFEQCRAFVENFEKEP